MRAVWVGIGILSIGCGDGTQSPQPESSASRPSRAESGVPTPPASLDSTYATAWRDPSCETDTVQSHVNPLALVREYVTRNETRGYFVGGGNENNDWLFKAAECPGHLGGTDGMGVVIGHSIASMPAGADSARYIVEYQMIGSTDPEVEHYRFVPSSAIVQDTVVLIKTPFGWRITGQPGNPWMGPTAIARYVNLDTGSLRSLDSAARAGVQRSRPGT